MAIRLVNDMFGRLREVEKERDRLKAKLESMMELQSYVDAGVIRVEVDSVEGAELDTVGPSPEPGDTAQMLENRKRYLDNMVDSSNWDKTGAMCKSAPLNDKCDQKLDNEVSGHISGEAGDIVSVPPRVRPDIVPKGALWDYAENGLGKLVAIWVKSNAVKIEDHYRVGDASCAWTWMDDDIKEEWTDYDLDLSPDLYDACKDLYEGNRGSVS